MIVTSQGTAEYAARICDLLVFNGYDDWFLPSKDELFEMYFQKATIEATSIANGGEGFASVPSSSTSSYWSSSEYDSSQAWYSNFQFDVHTNDDKLFPGHSRAIRVF